MVLNRWSGGDLAREPFFTKLKSIERVCRGRPTGGPREAHGACGEDIRPIWYQFVGSGRALWWETFACHFLTCVCLAVQVGIG